MVKLMSAVFCLFWLVQLNSECREDRAGLQLMAVARIHKAGSPNEIMGYVEFFQTSDRPPMIMMNETLVNAGNYGDHGIHVHEYGDLVSSTDCKPAKGHYNPLKQDHGGPFDKFRHIGDMGNFAVTVASDDFRSSGAERKFPITSLPVEGMYSIIGRMVVVHAGTDDYGKEGHPDSKTTGHAGARLGCGVIGIASDFSVANRDVQVDNHPDGMLKASARLHPVKGHGSISGDVTFEQESVGSPVRVKGTITGVQPGMHGFHIHTYGNLNSTDCTAAGGHFNSENKVHGSRVSSIRHIGDLGNIEVDASGESEFDFLMSNEQALPLLGPNSIVGRMIVLHSGKDDLGKGNVPASKKTGDAGSRLACGVIGIGSDFGPAGVKSSSSRVITSKFNLCLILLFAFRFMFM